MDKENGSMKKASRFVPHAVVFISSMGIMIVELVASRLVSKYLGSSLYTWTSVIGIVLGGISLGNWLGGKLADRYQPRRIIPFILLAASVLTVLIVVLDIVVGRMTNIFQNTTISMNILVSSVLLITALFFLPSCAMGTVSPVMAKYALEQAKGVGKTVGGIYASGALGSIAGTFLTGYLLIPALGLTTNILLVGAALAALSLAMGGRRVVSGAWLLALAALTALGTPHALALRAAADPLGRTRLVFEKDSPYSYIQVTDDTSWGTMERDLRLDALIHNRFDPARPDELLYSYERIFAAITLTAFQELSADESLKTLTLGGGAFTLPSYLERHYPGGSHEVAEIDPDVVETAHRWFGLAWDTHLGITVKDARNYLDGVVGKKTFDIVYCDAFNAFSVPSHLTTREFIEKTAGVLRPRGLFLANVIDMFNTGRFLNAYLNTLRTVFPQVSVFMSSDSGLSGRATFVVVAGRQPFTAEILEDSAGAVVGTRLSRELLEDLAARNGGAILTDDHAPVENLMAPVFLGNVD
jgi:spermidine synthase